MRNFLIALLVLLMSLCASSALALHYDFFNCLHGDGAVGCLDHWNGSVLEDGYVAVVSELSNKYICFLDEDSGASETFTGDNPIVAPHSNPGDKRWKCTKAAASGGDGLPANWSDVSDDLGGADTAAIRPDATTSGNDIRIQAYDVDGTAWLNCMRFENANDPLIIFGCSVTNLVYDGAGSGNTHRHEDGSSPTVNTAGQIKIDTSDDQLLYYGGALRVISYKDRECFTVQDIDETDHSNVPIFSHHDAITVTNMRCWTEGGTSVVITLSDGSNNLDSMTCDADGANDDGSISNATFTSNEQMEFDTGTETGTVDFVNFCFSYTLTRE